MKKISFRLRIAIILSSAIALFIYLFLGPVITQPQSYHHFVDQREFFGIANAQDVLSNIFFLIVGIMGLKVVTTEKKLITKKSWLWHFLSIILIAPGSAYYHLDPNDGTLVWDRLPMSMGFMALYISLLSEHCDLKFEKYIYPSLLLGIISVGTWVLTHDLRFYLWIQFSSFCTIPLILAFFPSRFNYKRGYFYALFFYGLAKWSENRDAEIFHATHEIISGHTLKHILAALGISMLWWMVKIRRENSLTVSNRGIAYPAWSLKQ